IGLYTADTGKYLFIDTHHIISDGESLNVLMEDIDRAYMGEEIEPEAFTGFEAALSEERARSSGRLDKAREWYDGVYGKGAKVSLPPKDIVDNPADEGSFILTGEISAERIRAFCEENHLGLNAFFTTATGLALKVCTGDERGVFASIYNGRNDSRLGRSIGMFVKTLPICIGPSQKTKVAAAIDVCQKMLVQEMAYDIFSFAEICSAYGLSSDVLFAYQGDLSDDETLLIGGKEAKEKELETGDNTARSPFGLDIYLKDNKVCYEFEYDTSMYKRSTMEDFFRLTELIVKGFLTESTIGDILGLSEIKEFSAKAALRKKEEKPDAAEDKTDTGSKHVVIGGPKQAKVLDDLILDVFRKVLKKDDLGPDDDFFANGGSSLLAAKVMMAVMVKDYPIEFQDIFNQPTAGALTAHIFHRLTEHWHEEEQPGKAGTEENSNKAPAKEYEKALSHNTPEYLDEIRSESLGKVLLAGPTGFLGIHVLRELLESGVEKVYCLLRSSHISAQDRLKQTYFYYFDELDEDRFKNKIVVLDGDITNKERIEDLAKYDIDTVINCAASVKHFAELDFLKNVNVNGVANLIDLCLKKKARLVHISTVSVCGERDVDSKGEDTLTENAIDIGQDVESNAYVYSKYLAEKLVLDAIEEKNLDAKIIRMGNLTARYKDGEFQINFKTNNFMNTLKAYVALGCFPVQEMDEMDEFSPIDEVAKATVLLSGTNREFTVFHAYNSHLVEMGDLVQALNDNDLKVDVVHEREYNDRLKAALADESINSSVSPLVNYKTDHDESIVENDVDNAFTIKALYRLGFHWHITDMDYIDSVILMLKTLGFFEY
ncbi:MAG: SDR family oxidoreductase, partial [Lachnospiraceae bacterium]|nr:SDR family oxidoreductase [Lachnospiraceae bacterium]